MNEYEVGQILFLANEKSFKIIPVQVVEEVTRTTIEGKFKTYLIMFPDKKRSVVDISNVKIRHFKSEEEVRTHLIENTKKAIEGLIKSANIVKQEAFGVTQPKENKKESSFKEQPVQQEKKSDIIKIDLGNGQTGNFKVKDLITGKK
jgi:hypothetical protein